MSSAEIQFSAPGGLNLADALREALGEGGRVPSRRQVRTWIAEGRVRVEDEVTKDPERALVAGERVDLQPAVGAAPPTRTAAVSGAGGAAGILHLDRHLLVVAYHPSVAAGPAARHALAVLERALVEAGIRDVEPRPVPAPEGRASGVLAAALSDAAEGVLAEAFATGEAALEVVAVVEAPRGADLEGLAVEAEAGPVLRLRMPDVASVAWALDELDRRGLRVLAAPGPEVVGRLRLHVARIRLPHPRTGRALSWTLAPPPDPSIDLG